MPAAGQQTVRMQTSYDLVPIGWVQSALTVLDDAPNQREGAPRAWIRFDEQVAEGVRDLRPGDEIVVLTWLHLSRRDELRWRHLNRADRRSVPLHHLGPGAPAAGSHLALSLVRLCPTRLLSSTVPSPLSAAIDGLLPVMRRGDLAGFQQIFSRLYHDAGACRRMS